MGFLMGGSSSTPPPPPSPPPAANPATYANSSVQATGAAAKAKAAAASGAGFDGTVMTSPEGTGSAPTATKQLTGQ